jgi:hypothetical protein
MTMDVKGTWSMYGFASQRHFRHWLGQKVGNKLRESIVKHASKAITK